MQGVRAPSARRPSVPRDEHAHRRRPRRRRPRASSGTRSPSSRAGATRTPLVIERAEGCTLCDADGTRYIDGVSSLWCNVHGHRHPRDRRRDPRAARPRRAHDDARPDARAGAIELAERLVELAPDGLSRVFYSDSGSTAIEIALKMAFQYWHQRGERWRVRASSACANSYHGDTIGSVSVGGIELFHSLYRPLLFDDASGRARRRRPTSSGCSTEHGERDRGGHRRAARPGRGRHPRPPARLPARGARALRPARRASHLRRGRDRLRPHRARCSPASRRASTPDLLCVAKGITGGYLPLAATLTTERVYEGFLGAHERVPHLLPRPHLHRQPARLRGRARDARRLRGGAHARAPAAEDRAARASCSTSTSRRCRACARSGGAASWSASSSTDFPVAAAHRATGHARGARARRDHPPARRHGRADAAARDRGGSAGAARASDRRGDRRGDERPARAARPDGAAARAVATLSPRTG